MNYITELNQDTNIVLLVHMFYGKIRLFSDIDVGT